MAEWKTDEELFALIRNELSTPPVSDVMEQLGFRYPMLPPELRPLRSDMVMIGRAMPVQDELPVEYGARHASMPSRLVCCSSRLRLFSPTRCTSPPADQPMLLA